MRSASSVVGEKRSGLLSTAWISVMFALRIAPLD
jgi:hypothetical protein